MNKPNVLVKSPFAIFEAHRGLISKDRATPNIATTPPLSSATVFRRI